MKNKTFLAIILLTPILVVVISSIYFSMGMSPDGTRNNGIFFKSYFDFNQFKNKYPRVKIIEDQNGVLLNVLQKNSKINFNIENPIFIIDPYGRAVMYFEPGSDPKLMLKDLKVLI